MSQSSTHPEEQEELQAQHRPLRSLPTIASNETAQDDASEAKTVAKSLRCVDVMALVMQDSCVGG